MTPRTAAGRGAPAPAAGNAGAGAVAVGAAGAGAPLRLSSWPRSSPPAAAGLAPASRMRITLRAVSSASRSAESAGDDTLAGSLTAFDSGGAAGAADAINGRSRPAPV